jgi:DNA-binding transcriptional MerR regulator
LAIITRIISEHHAIRGHIKLAGDTVNDIEALLTLQRTQSGWSQTSITALVEKRDQLLQMISFLEEGLKNHFDFEEEVLPLLFGKLLMKAIMHEHHNISGQIGSAKTTLANIELEGLDQRELFSKKSVIQQGIDSLCQTVEEHAQHEETILGMMKKALDRDKV